MIRVVKVPFVATWSSGSPTGDRSFSRGERLYFEDIGQPGNIEFVHEDDCFKKNAANYLIERKVFMDHSRPDPCPHYDSKPDIEQRTDVDWRHCNDCGEDYQISLGFDQR